MKCVQIYRDGRMEEIELPRKSKITNLTQDELNKFLCKNTKSQGQDDIKELYKWIHEDYNIKCLGWYDGDAGFENKHDLPPGGNSSFLEEDSSEKLLFGDIFIIKTKEDKLCNINISDYGEFYNVIFGGFDDCDTSSEEEYVNENITHEEKNGNDTDDDYEILSDFDETTELEIDTSVY